MYPKQLQGPSVEVASPRARSPKIKAYKKRGFCHATAQDDVSDFFENCCRHCCTIKELRPGIPGYWFSCLASDLCATNRIQAAASEKIDRKIVGPMSLRTCPRFYVYNALISCASRLTRLGTLGLASVPARTCTCLVTILNYRGTITKH